MIQKVGKNLLKILIFSLIDWQLKNLPAIQASKAFCNHGDKSARDGINKLTVYCNNSTSMRLTWIKPQGAMWYKIRISDMDSNCLNFNVTDEEFIFDKQKSFSAKKQYWAIVTPYPRPDGPIPHIRNSMFLSSCPKISEWTTWGAWSSCHSRGCKKDGRKYRERDCQRKGSNESYEPVTCPPPFIKKDSTKCTKECSIKVCPTNFQRSGVMVKNVFGSCAGVDSMRLTWEKVQGARNYTVAIVDDRKKCIEINAIDEEVIFSKDVGFRSTRKYWGNVIAYTGDVKKEESIRLSSNSEIAIQFGSCPRKGEWGAWERWSKCEGTCDTIGTMYRTRKCFLIDKKIPVDHIDCPSPWNSNQKTEQSKKCFKNCGTKSTITTQTITTFYVASVYNIQQSSSGLIIAIGISSAMLAIIVLFIVILNQRMKRQHIHSQSIASGKGFLKTISVTYDEVQNSLFDDAWMPSVYVSHLTEHNKEEQMLNLVQYISSYGVACTVDLLCQVDINKMGGLANWLPDNIRSANKILVILSKAYLKALNAATDVFDFEVCKIHSEFHYIKSLLYHSLQRVQLVIVLDGVKIEDVPDPLKGRIYCKFPKSFNSQDEHCHRLIGLLLDEEPLVIEVRESRSSSSGSSSSFSTEGSSVPPSPGVKDPLLI